MITFCTQKTVFKKSIFGGTKCVNAPIFYTTDVHYKYFTKIYHLSLLITDFFVMFTKSYKLHYLPQTFAHLFTTFDLLYYWCC